MPSYRYAIIMSRKIINQQRDLILRKIKTWYTKPDSDVVRRQLVVFLDFAERNQALLTGTTISEITDCGPTIKLATWPARSEDIEKGGKLIRSIRTVRRLQFPITRLRTIGLQDRQSSR